MNFLLCRVRTIVDQQAEVVHNHVMIKNFISLLPLWYGMVFMFSKDIKILINVCCSSGQGIN